MPNLTNCGTTKNLKKPKWFKEPDNLWYSVILITHPIDEVSPVPKIIKTFNNKKDAVAYSKFRLFTRVINFKI